MTLLARRLVVTSSVAIGFLLGCGPDGSEASSALLPTDTVVAERVATIGDLTGPPEYLFGDVTSVAAAGDGTLYVADRIGSTVRAFDSEGRHLGIVGSEGEGPGEFNWPSDLTFDPAGRLYVRDRTRLSVFERRPDGELADSLVRTVALGGAQAGARRGRTDGSRYYLPSYHYWMFVNHSYFYLVVDSLGLTGDTVAVHGIENPEVFGRTNYLHQSGEFGVPVEGVNLAPFEAAPSWDITPGGHVVITPGDRHEVTEWTVAGDTARVIRGATLARPIPRSAAVDSARAFRSRLDSIPVPLEEVRGMSDLARRRELPELLPEIVALHVDPVGHVWLRRWPPAGAAETFFDVLDAEGRPLRTVRVPADLALDPLPWVSPDLVVGVSVDPETGVESVLVFTVGEG